MKETTDDKWFIAHMEDLAQAASKGGYAVFSDFLDDHQRGLLSQMEGRLPVLLDFFGGYPEAGRVICAFYPDYLKDSIKELEQEEIRLIKVTPADRRFLKRIPEHRDYLGSIMGTGIKREKVGDILVEDGIGYVVLKPEMVDYLENELTNVANSIVHIESVSVEELPEPQQGEIFVISVPSMRIDSIVCRGFKMGRQDAAKLISQGLVSKNGSIINQVDKTAAVGDKVTARGKGLLRILENKGMSRSGRIQLEIELFGKKKGK